VISCFGLGVLIVVDVVTVVKWYVWRLALVLQEDVMVLIVATVKAAVGNKTIRF